MITESSYFVLQYRKGGYLCRRGHWPADAAGCHTGEPLVYHYRLTPDPMEANRARNRDAIGQLIVEWYWRREDFFVVAAPVCGCCGSPELIRHGSGFLSPFRCGAHADRNPCAIEGCTKTRAAPKRAGGGAWLANNQWLCPEHWRRFVPPRSKIRRAYNRFWAIAKRQGGWDARLEQRFVRFWRGLIAMARRRAAEGHLDKAAIDRLMGWD